MLLRTQINTQPWISSGKSGSVSCDGVFWRVPGASTFWIHATTGSHALPKVPFYRLPLSSEEKDKHRRSRACFLGLSQSYRDAGLQFG